MTAYKHENGSNSSNRVVKRVSPGQSPAEKGWVDASILPASKSNPIALEILIQKSVCASIGKRRPSGKTGSEFVS